MNIFDVSEYNYHQYLLNDLIKIITQPLICNRNKKKYPLADKEKTKYRNKVILLLIKTGLIEIS